MVFRRWILIILVIPWLYLQHHQQIKVITYHIKCVIGWVWHFWFWLKCLTIYGWIAIEFGTHSHVPLRMNSNSLCDILISHLALSSGQNVNFSSTLVCDKVPQKIMKMWKLANVIRLCIYNIMWCKLAKTLLNPFSWALLPLRIHSFHCQHLTFQYSNICKVEFHN